MSQVVAQPVDLQSLARTAAQIRAQVVRMSHRGKAPHLGSGLSCVDILVAAFFAAYRVRPDSPEAPDRDRVILSKGHAAAALYATLAYRGFFPVERLAEFNRPGGTMPEQPGPHGVPGVELATGSLGHGLPIGLGMALAGRIHKLDYRVCVIMSDGECNEGSVWEAAMLAPALKLANLTVVVDFNKWQATGRSQEVMALQPLADKWRAFGWQAREVDGHNLGALIEALNHAAAGNQPRAVIAHTIKGRGVSFMQDDNNWHYRIPTAEEVAAAERELAAAYGMESLGERCHEQASGVRG